MALRVTLIQGGGSGFDQVPAVKAIVQAAGVSVDWNEHLAGWAAIEQGEPPLPDRLLRSVRETGVALKTNLLPPPGKATLPGISRKAAGNFNVQLRRDLGLFASVRPLKNLPALPARFQGVDLLVIRELTEDLYAAIEHEIVPGVVQSIKVVTEAASQRFFRFAFGWAKSAGRKAIACVHKANILKLADGLFLEAFRQTARDFPELQTREIIVDNCCMQMVLRPHQFDVLVMGNLYGDLVSDLGAGIVGGISATAGINVGDGIRVFEAFHAETSAANQVSPLPLLLPAIDLLQAEKQEDAARRIWDAMGRVLSERQTLTPDLGGQATTSAMTEAIIAALK
jgi:isocitrate dehydrogenase (NAD+)